MSQSILSLFIKRDYAAGELYMQEPAVDRKGQARIAGVFQPFSLYILLKIRGKLLKS